MTYAELKAQIRDLGFSDDAEIEDFDGVVPHAINLAIAEINQIVGSVVGTHEVTLDGETDLTIIDMVDEAEGYLEMIEAPAMLKEYTTDEDGEEVLKDIFKVFNDYDTREDGRMVFVNSKGIKGVLKFYYKKQAQQYDIDSDDDLEIDLGLKYQPLIALLASYYVWLEDDQTKATYYYNRYETMLNSMVATKTPRVRILTGGI